MTPARRWVAHSNAIAACRLVRLLYLPVEFSSWWLQSVRQGMEDELQKIDRELYYALHRGRPALKGVLDAVGNVDTAVEIASFFDGEAEA